MANNVIARALQLLGIRGKVALAEGRTLIYDPSLEVEIEEVDPVGADTTKSWGTPVLYRIHLKTRAKEYQGEIKIM